MESPVYKRYVTTVLLIAYIFNQMDRTIFGFVLEPMKRDLALTDSELGFLAGPALFLVYALLGIPVARFADGSNRVNIMSVAIALWSAIVTMTAVVQSFPQLAWVRIGVGIGEAGFSAIAIAVIADYHRPEERARALSLFMLGLPLGAVASSLVAGWVNELHGWRAVFVVAGVPGLLVAMLMKSTVQEPPRVGARSPAEEAGHKPALRVALATMWNNHTLRHLAVAQGLAALIQAALVTWVPTFFIRNHGMISSELGTWLAAINAIGGGLGIWLSGQLVSRFVPQDERIHVRMMGVAMVLVAPLWAFALWSVSKQAAFMILLPGYALVFFFFAPTAAVVQALSAASMRATMASLFILIQGLAGGVIGVQLVGFLSDVFTSISGSNAAALRWAMTSIAVLALWSAAHFWIAGTSRASR